MPLWQCPLCLAEQTLSEAKGLQKFNAISCGILAPFAAERRESLHSDWPTHLTAGPKAPLGSDCSGDCREKLQGISHCGLRAFTATDGHGMAWHGQWHQVALQSGCGLITPCLKAASRRDDRAAKPRRCGLGHGHTRHEAMAWHHAPAHHRSPYVTARFGLRYSSAHSSVCDRSGRY